MGQIETALSAKLAEEGAAGSAGLVILAGPIPRISRRIINHL
jgi:hypothetical protein